MSQHWYLPTGEPTSPGIGYPSVTTILSVRHNEGLQSWRDRMGAEEADAYKAERADVGTRVHATIEVAMRANPVEIMMAQFAMQEDVYPYMQGFANWFDKYLPTKIQPEKFLFHELHEYAGTADLICEIDGEPWLIDFKTSKRISDSFALQLSAYQQAYFYMTGIECRRAVLQLTPELKRGWRWKEFTDFNDFGVFMAHKEIFDWQQSLKPEIKQTVSWTGGMIE